MSREAAASRLRFFLGGLGAFIVPRALRAAGWTLETMDERYGTDRSQRVQDTQWIEEATLAGDILLCKDLAIAQNPLEAQAVYMTSAMVFAGDAGSPASHTSQLPARAFGPFRNELSDAPVGDGHHPILAIR